MTVRDRFSKIFVEGMVVGRRIELEPNPVLRFKPNVDKAVGILKNLGLNSNTTIIGLNIRLLKGWNFVRVVHCIVKALNAYLREHNAVVLYIPFGFGNGSERFFDNDVVMGHMVKRVLSKDVRGRVYILKRKFHPNVTLGLL